MHSIRDCHNIWLCKMLRTKTGQGTKQAFSKEIVPDKIMRDLLYDLGEVGHEISLSHYQSRWLRAQKLRAVFALTKDLFMKKACNYFFLFNSTGSQSQFA